MSETTKDATWAIVEIMGHQKYAGLCTEQPVAGVNMLRIDVPESGAEPAFTKLFGGTAIFSMTPVSEEVARAVARSIQKAPVNVWELPADLRQKIEQRTITLPESRQQLVPDMYCEICGCEISRTNLTGVCADCEVEDDDPDFHS